MRTFVLWLFVLIALASGWCVSLVPARAQEGKPAADKPAEKPAAKADEKKDEKKEEPKENFIRVDRDDKGVPQSMDTGIASYVSADGKRPGVVIDLIGAVHVGDKAYYDELNKKFEAYEVLLYELVAPPNTRIPKGGKNESAHPIAALQSGMKSMLGLEHQLECIDYTKANFVHADMSPEEFAKSMKDRGESFTQMFLRAIGAGMAQQATGKQGTSDFEILSALFSKNRSQKLKLAMAGQFEDLDSQVTLFDGPEGSTILTERNRKAFEVLAKQLDEGKKKIGIFYGAAHLPDMDKRLLADFGMKRNGEISWVKAWSLGESKPAASPKKGEEKKEESKAAEKK
jgi:hypothetical protein